MGKQQHFTPQQLMAQMQIQKIVDAEVKKQMEGYTMSERVVRGIRAAHKADIIITMMVLLDGCEWDDDPCIADMKRKTFSRDFLDKWTEVLKQYNSGELSLRQQVGHIEVVTGINILDYVEKNMDLADIKECKNEEIKNIIDGAVVDDAFDKFNKSGSAGGGKS